MTVAKAKEEVCIFVQIPPPYIGKIECAVNAGLVEINQLSATSRICVPEGVTFAAVRKGIATSISYEKNGELSEDFSTSEADNVIELNGIKSELVIYTSSDETLCGAANEQIYIQTGPLLYDLFCSYMGILDFGSSHKPSGK